MSPELFLVFDREDLLSRPPIGLEGGHRLQAVTRSANKIRKDNSTAISRIISATTAGVVSAATVGVISTTTSRVASTAERLYRIQSYCGITENIRIQGSGRRTTITAIASAATIIAAVTTAIVVAAIITAVIAATNGTAGWNNTVGDSNRNIFCYCLCVENLGCCIS